MTPKQYHNKIAQCLRCRWITAMPHDDICSKYNGDDGDDILPGNIDCLSCRADESKCGKQAKGFEPIKALSICQPWAHFIMYCGKDIENRNWLPGQQSQFRADRKSTYLNPLGRNRRNVWTIATAAFRDAHFATFPPALVKPCILAGCPFGGVVLDPFGGAGTVGVVAEKMGRDSVLIELNADYAQMSAARIRSKLGRVKIDAPPPELTFPPRLDRDDDYQETCHG